MLTFSNPSLRKEIADYPLGGSKRGACVFEIETTSKGSRCLRTTTGKPKVSTYAARMALVDGDDGRTYFIAESPYGGKMLTIYRSDFKNADDCSVFGESDPERYNQLIALVNEANKN